MIATFINCATVLIGSIIGLLFNRRVTDRFRDVIYTGIGMFTMVIGIMMALETTRILFVALSVVIGGLLGTWWSIERRILGLGHLLERKFGGSQKGESGSFAFGYLSASILFCVGAMTIVGSFKAGAEGSYDIIYTKSVMDGFMAILLTAAMGIGVAFSIITILIYQGGLTLLAGLLSPYISPLVLSELSGTGGILLMMIGLNLLKLKELKTGDFLPALAIIIVFAMLEPKILSWISG
ncbi:MAG: hypothetical protein CMN78_00490 [Spirochaetales bacterium]|nr:hypothetical protein [Spirochaetales bacterium]